MQRDRLSRHRKFLRNGVEVKWLLSDQTNDLSSGGVGYGLKNIPSGFHVMQVSTCKYKCKYLLAQFFQIKLLGFFYT